jgi:hypothetical protein
MHVTSFISCEGSALYYQLFSFNAMLPSEFAMLFGCGRNAIWTWYRMRLQCACRNLEKYWYRICIQRARVSQS